MRLFSNSRFRRFHPHSAPASLATRSCLACSRLPALAAGWAGRAQRAALVGDGGMVQLTGSVVENPHGLHWNTFRFSAKARLIIYSKIIGRPQTGQMISFVGVTSSLITHLRMR
jgi:hypothetical protein